jgi:hypothetical protein
MHKLYCEENEKLDQEFCLVKPSRWKGKGKGGMGHRNIAFFPFLISNHDAIKHTQNITK